MKVNDEVRSDEGAPQSAPTAFVISQVGALVAERFAERLGEIDLTPAHVGILRLISRHSHQSQRAVAEQLGIQPSRLVSYLDDLEQRGLVKRQRSANDRRNHELHLTNAGRRTLGNVREIAIANGDQILGCLDVTEQDLLAELLAKVATHAGLVDGVHPGYRQL